MKIVKGYLFVALGIVLGAMLVGGCSNKVNTWGSRQFHMATTRWNVYFNGKESFKEGQKLIAKNHKENFDKLLPVYFENDIPVRETASAQMERAVNKAVKAIELHSITAKPVRKKGKRTSEKYREFRRKKEYNNMIDECYLLLGKAQFYRREYYSTERTFRYILREFNDMPMHYESAIWYARTLGEQNKYFRALRTLDDVMKEDGFPEKLIPMARTAKADVFIRRGLYKKAIEELQFLTENTTKKQGQTRYYYLLAQLYNMQGDIEKSQATYADLIATHPEYIYTFHAKLSKALLYGEYGLAESSTKVKSELRSLIRDGRNKRFLDQVYYTLAKVYEKEGNLEKAEKNYLLASEKNRGDKKQQAKTLLALGDLYFGKKEYALALQNYKEATSMITKEYPRYEEVKTRLESLAQLAGNLATVELQDSLRRIAQMPTMERELFIKDLMVKEREELVADKGRKAKKKLQKDLEGLNRPIGKWYFYNPMAVAQGKKEFEKKWGKLNLADNWRTSPEVFRLSAEERSEQSRDTLKFRTYEDYVKDLPLTETAMEQSKAKSIQALYDAGVIYEDEMDDYIKAKASFEEVLERKPKSEAKQLRANYHLYMLNSLLDKTAEAERYKQLILREFPDSDLAKVLQNPAYYTEMVERGEQAEKLYEKAYNLYAKYEFSQAQKMIEEGMKTYKGTVAYQRFAFLNAMTKAYTETPESFKKALEEVEKVAIDKKILTTTQGLLAQLAQGKMPNSQVNKNRKRYTLDDFKNTTVEVSDKKVHIGKIEIPKAYKMEGDAKHYVALILPRDLQGRVLKSIEKFNKKTFANQKLRVNRRNFSLNTDIILVEFFNGKEEALQYFERLVVAEKEFLRAINEVDYTNLIITERNLLKLTADRDVVPYLDFYEYYYLGKGNNPEENNNEENSENVVPKGQIEQEVKTENLTPSVVFNTNLESGHNFVLIVPRKGVDVNYLWTALHQFDKNFRVKKEKFGEQRMLIVQGIGNKKEAMDYLKKVVQEKYIYGNLKDVQYRNFIITDENLGTLRSTKAVDNYIQFFKDNYLK
ncbi:MAG: tetratricopeptide repeat protein [Flavobacteriaceae bacterium]|nr:tetratricopeptide repeat protein [Flavobacteriaceae bacterium]